MRFAFKCLAFAIVFAIWTAASAIGTTLVTSSNIKDETIEAQDLGGDITRVKSVSATIDPSDDDWACPDPNDDSTCYPVEGSGGGTRRITVTCASGNVTGGGVKPVDVEQGYNLDIYASYPATDRSWTFALSNSGPDPIPVQLRVECI